MWLCGGVESDTPEGKIIQWSQPEIVLYDDDPYVRMSYPDLVQEGGRCFLSETQKDVARVHEIDPALLDGLWKQLDGAAEASIATNGLLLSLPEAGGAMPGETDSPHLPDFLMRDSKRADYGTKDLRQGFTIEMWARFDSLAAGQVLLDNRAADRRGFCLETTPRAALEIALNDGRTESRWDCDPGMLTAGPLHHVVVIVDGGPKIITFIVDGKLDDGGEFRQFGWGRFNPHLRSVNGGPTLRIAPGFGGEIKRLRIYNRYLHASEAIANYKSGLA